MFRRCRSSLWTRKKLKSWKSTQIFCERPANTRSVSTWFYTCFRLFTPAYTFQLNDSIIPSMDNSCTFTKYLSHFSVSNVRKPHWIGIDLQLPCKGYAGASATKLILATVPTQTLEQEPSATQCAYIDSDNWQTQRTNTWPGEATSAPSLAVCGICYMSFV